MPDRGEGGHRSATTASNSRSSSIPAQSRGEGSSRAAARRAAASGGRRGAAKDGRHGTSRSSRKQQRGKRAKRIALGVSAFAVLVVGAGVVWLQQLDGNIKHGALDSAGPQRGAVIPGVVNILMIGSDTRNSALDTRLGGADNSLPHADVEMLVHISADHDNATVLSIPRDTDIPMPTCTVNGKQYGGQQHSQITNSLNYGPGCTVAAVNQLTNVHIDHYMVVDFGGVVSMSDAVGGVDVCMNQNVYDPASHLKLSAGQHTLQGQAALEFLRTRHALGDGSDTQRTVTQHIFLSALIRKLKSAGTLADPANVFNLSEAATKAFAVDDGLAGISNLAGLANTLSQVPADHITFATMPYASDPYNPNAWVVPGPGANQLFQAIATDQSLTPAKSAAPAKASAKPTPTPTPAVAPDSVPIHVLNGTTTSGLATKVQTELADKGYTDTVVGNTAAVTATKVRYSTASPLYKQEARQVAAALGLPSSALDPTGTGARIYLLIGPDLAAGGAGAAAKPTVDIASATANANTENAARNSGCVSASPYHLSALPGSLASWAGLSPEAAYARATREGIPDSDKAK